MVEIKCQDPFASFSYMILAVSCCFFLVNKALIKLRVNSDGELNASKYTGNEFLKNVKVFETAYTYKKSAMDILGYFGYSEFAQFTQFFSLLRTKEFVKISDQ